MARPIRVEFADAVYHVMARGNERKAIFHDDHDRTRFLATLQEMTEQFGVQVHGYCLMPNHYHLVLSTPRGNLSRAAGWLQTTYTIRFNRRHRRAGHLFQGRFKAQLVEAESYGRELIRYVHLNPVRPRHKSEPIAAERAAELDHYRWSSHRAYAGLEREPGWLSLDWLRMFGHRRKEAQAEYRRAMRQVFGQVLANPWEELKGGLVLGGADLWRAVQRKIGGQERGEEQRWMRRVGGVEVQRRIRELVATEVDDRVRVWARVQVGGERRVDVGREFGYRDGSGVTQMVKRLEASAARDRRLAMRMRDIRDVLS